MKIPRTKSVNVLVIHTESEYNQFLDRIDVLMGSVCPKSMRELDDLVSAVEIYENIHYPIDIPSQQAMIDFRKDQDNV